MVAGVRRLAALAFPCRLPLSPSPLGLHLTDGGVQRDGFENLAS